MSDYADARVRMVDSQLRTEDVTDYGILAAMGDVPRELFVPDRLKPLAYIDEDLLIKAAVDGAPARYLMEPAPFARLLQAAGIASTDAVLDVGCGTGYTAAVLARLADRVVALDSDESLAAEAVRLLRDLGAANVGVEEGPLEAGDTNGAPYDVIVLEGSVEVVPEALFAQLAEGGRLVAVVGYGRAASATVFTKTDGDVGARKAFDAHVPRLPGFEKPKAFVF
ncbi:MAG: protein-L-isoaspartate O-methyltransferase [Bauldia sp.]